MKKFFIMMLAMSSVFTSCDELFKDKEDEGIVSPVPDGPPTSELEPDAQKARLETVAENFMDECAPADFEEFFDLSSKFGRKYIDGKGDEYWEPFFEFCEERGEEMFIPSESEKEKNGEKYYYWSIEAMLEFSQLHGNLTLGETSATCRDYNGTKVTFTLDGKEYVAEMTTSGKTEKAIYTFEDIYGREEYTGYYDPNTGYWTSEYVMVHYNDKYQFEVLVPEKVAVTLKRNGADYATIDIVFTKRFTASGVSLTKDCFQITTTITIGNHSIVISKTGYDALTNNASVSFALKEGAKELVTATAAAKVEVELVTEERNWENEYYSTTYPEFTLAKDFSVYVDILGQLQIAGSCKNALTLSENIDNFYSAENSSQAKRAIDNINNYLDLGIYYDKSSTRQADVVMDYYVEEDEYWGDTWYELEPIIQFPDKSKYAIYEYFDESSFSGLTNSFELWLEMYETMLEHYFD